ncbi:adenosine deaminase [Paenibacillus sp. GSMTC-2017]|uniref:adenosine deaminase n=1 Tax=Paenibacillus sp. GSMTC-2017 TaxID=2794350 RepID=UPI0018D80514|nr:adenosine deaminase [Paenibacillus sp. GSMTC-2017]MBH5319535.1 adenosine deaminase [Paenibacillus sp. GSMTC-2017]
MINLKVANTFIAALLLSTSISIPAFAQDRENSPSSLPVSQMGQAVSLSDLVKSTTSNSVTFTDGSTLDQYDNYYIATDSNGEEFKITKVDDNKVKYENLQTGEVNYAIKEVEPMQEKLKLSAQASSEGFVYKGAEKNSTEIQYATASLIAGILASFIGGPATGKFLGVLVSIGGYYLSLEAPRAYWIEKTYTKTVKHSDFSATLTIRKDFHYYRYHDYTEFINTVSTIQMCQPYGCGAVEEYTN